MILARLGGNGSEVARPDQPEIDYWLLHIQKKGGAQVVSFGMSEEDVRLFMTEKFVATASDGSSMVPGKTVPHPRGVCRGIAGAPE